MAPGAVEDAAKTNGPPSSTSGLLTPSEASSEHWTPQTVLSTLPHPPQPNTTSALPFFHTLERLKTSKREGWRRFGLEHGESIADHMYRMSIITLLCPASLAARLNIQRCTQMALIHDMAESLVGDITPVDGIAKAEKSRRESETMDFLCAKLLGSVDGGQQGRQFKEIWQEYEDGETLESAFVHDVDKMELLLQMMEYERNAEGRLDLGEFSRVAKRIVLPEVQNWAEQLLKERRDFWDGLGREPSGVKDISEEMKRQQDEYYDGQTNGTS